MVLVRDAGRRACMHTFLPWRWHVRWTVSGPKLNCLPLSSDAMIVWISVAPAHARRAVLTCTARDTTAAICNPGGGYMNFEEL